MAETATLEPTKETLKFLKEIQIQYTEAKRKKISRFNVEWGKWSHEFNKELKQRIETEHPQAIFYKYLFMYWTVLSQLLELHHCNKFFKKGPKRKLVREAKAIKKIIVSGDIPIK